MVQMICTVQIDQDLSEVWKVTTVDVFLASAASLERLIDLPLH